VALNLKDVNDMLGGSDVLLYFMSCFVVETFLPLAAAVFRGMHPPAFF